MPRDLRARAEAHNERLMRTLAPAKRTGGGDPGWLAAHAELRDLHREKSATYGTGEDPLANFGAVAGVTGRAPEVYALERIVEKASRALNMLAAGDGAAVAEFPDIAGLALCAEALRRRRL